jgi:2-desacetyl-2-hydroxyethyl bacteriochlorophyllide A dehydrogenase
MLSRVDQVLWVTMRAIRFTHQTLSVESVDKPSPGKGECLIRVTRAGICATDLEIVRGYASFQGTLGHEFVGVVEYGDTPLLGQRVVGDINCACQDCAWCARGQGHHCPNRTVLGIVERPGAFADYLILPASNLVAIPPQVPDEMAVFAEPLAAALRIHEQVDLAAIQTALVVGDGRLGSLIAMSLASAGVSTTILGRHPERAHFYGSLGIAFVSEAPRIQHALVVDATGHPTGLETALECTAPQGKLVLKSTCADASTINLSRLVVDEIEILGSRCGPMDTAMAFLASGRIDPTGLIHHEFSIDDGVSAFEQAGQRGCLKVLLRF